MTRGEKNSVTVAVETIGLEDKQTYGLEIPTNERKVAEFVKKNASKWLADGKHVRSVFYKNGADVVLLPDDFEVTDKTELAISIEDNISAPNAKIGARLEAGKGFQDVLKKTEEDHDAMLQSNIAQERNPGKITNELLVGFAGYGWNLVHNKATLPLFKESMDMGKTYKGKPYFDFLKFENGPLLENNTKSRSTLEQEQSYIASELGVSFMKGMFKCAANLSFAAAKAETKIHSVHTRKEYATTATAVVLSDEAESLLRPAVALGLKNLPKVFSDDNKKRFFSFFDEYGTHFAQHIVLGGVIESTVIVHHSEDLKETKIAAEVDAAIKLSILDLNVKAENRYESGSRKSESSLRVNTKVVGGTINYSNESNERRWNLTSNIDNYPAIVSHKLRSISALLPLHERDAVDAAIEAYFVRDDYEKPNAASHQVVEAKEAKDAEEEDTKANNNTFKDGKVNQYYEPDFASKLELRRSAKWRIVNKTNDTITHIQYRLVLIDNSLFLKGLAIAGMSLTPFGAIIAPTVGTLAMKEDAKNKNNRYTHEAILSRAINSKEAYVAETPIEFFVNESGLGNLYQYVCVHFGVHHKETKVNWLLRMEKDDIGSEITMEVYETYVNIIMPSGGGYCNFK